MRAGCSIFFAEADPAVYGMLRDFMARHSMEVCVLNDGRSLIERMEQDVPALILLRDGLPDMRAAVVLQTLREAGHDTPVIVIGDTPGSIELIICLELGADDYVRMPCDPRELLSRVQNVLRRVPIKAPALVGALGACQIGGFVVDFRTRSITRDGVTIVLHAGLFALLRLFLEHPLEVLSRRSIADKLKGFGPDHYERSLDVLICRLRRVVESDPSRRRTHQLLTVCAPCRTRHYSPGLYRSSSLSVTPLVHPKPSCNGYSPPPPPPVPAPSTTYFSTSFLSDA